MKKELRNSTPFRHVNFAHRGLYDNCGGVPENSLAAFRAAVKAGYSVELDVRLTKDEQVVVFHDETLERMCGKKSSVGDMTLSELKKAKLLDTDETVPTLEEALNVLSHGKGSLICELKAVGNYKMLCEKTLSLLRNYSGNFCVESFNPFVVRWFRKNAPDVFRGQLATTLDENIRLMRGFFAWLFSNCYMTIFNKPDFIAYKIAERPRHVINYCRKRKDVLLIAWTSTIPDIDQEENDAVIFEQYRPDPTY